MRPDVGLATLPQRLTGLRAMTPTPPPQPGGTAFADALDQQIGAQQGATATPQAPPAATGYAASPYVPSLLGQGAALAPGAGLGPGIRLSSTPGVITPQLPGAGGVHSCPECQPGVAGAGPAGPVILDRSGPPAELRAYGNGQIPAAALEPLGVGDHSLWAPAARAYRDLAAAAARDGVTIGINSSYRDLAGQQAMVARYGLYSQGGRAAVPGSSNHGWGLSLDLQLDDRAQAWMRDNATAFGFVEDVPREPWHWTFSASGYPG